MKRKASKPEENLPQKKFVPRHKRHPVRCWRCRTKLKPPPSRKRRSRVFRRICAFCTDWRALDAQKQSAKGRKPFMPAKLIEKRESAERAALAADMAAKRGTLCGPDDPLRDYTYWVQHEQALKKGSR